MSVALERKRSVPQLFFASVQLDKLAIVTFVSEYQSSYYFAEKRDRRRVLNISVLIEEVTTTRLDNAFGERRTDRATM